MNKQITKLFLAVFLLLVTNKAFSFDYSLHFSEKAFSNFKYNFSVYKIIDGRLNKNKSIGSVPSAWSLIPHTVGNDTLEKELNDYFIRKNPDFDTSLKVIVVIDQINTRFFTAYRKMGGKMEMLEMTFSLKYYSIHSNTCSLLYQCLFQHEKDVTFTGPQKSINNTFSETLAFAFEQFNNHIKLTNKTSFGEIDTSLFFSAYRSYPAQVLNKSNLKDGVYFCAKDFYLNTPAIIPGLELPDTTALRTTAITLKNEKYLIDRGYGIVKNGRIFIYIKDKIYSEARLSENGDLFFSNVKQSTLSKEARGGALIVGIARCILPLGFIGSVAADGTKSAIKKSGTTITTSDVIIDYETGEMKYK